MTAPVPERTRTPLERFNTWIFVVLVVALALSFAQRTTGVVVVEMLLRVTVIALVVVGLVRFRRGYFSHWTSYLAGVVALLSVFRILQVLLLG